MYLHLGHDTLVRMEDVIGIFDLDTSTIAKNTRNYLARAEKAGDVVSVTTDLPKTFIVVRDESRPSGQTVYLSQLSSATLLKRAGQMSKYEF